MAEYVRQIRERVDLVGFAGLDHGVIDRRGVPCTLGAHEQECFSPNGHFSYAPLNMSNSPVLTDAKGANMCADVHVANSGKTPANGVHLLRLTTYGSKAERTVSAFRPPQYLTASGDMLGTIGEKWGTSCTDPVDKTTENSLLDGSVPLYVYGVVQYFDIFGEYHETGFCSQRVLKGTPFIVCDGFGNWFEKRPGNEIGTHENTKQHPGRGKPGLSP